ncbi:MAG: general secretion pathway protein GspK [Candidatus Hydrogenedentes bacterium]|nr:general secretion pathway protein GspK [Candidatus Hydrogenedentota bacterium]
MSTSRCHRRNKSEQGAALLIALGLLAVFVILGIYYVNYMSIAWDETHYEIGRTRARLAAESGIRLALADLQYARSQEQTIQVLNRTLEYSLPVYIKQQGAGDEGFGKSDTHESRAAVRVLDENARIDINHAPASVLQRVLGIDGEMARSIVQSMPRQGETPAAPAPPAERADGEPEAAPAPAWFLSVDELVDRGFVSADQYANLDTSLLTAFGVTDHSQPQGSLNLNTASVGVLAAALDLAPEKAEELAAARPFKSLDGLASAAGKSPDTFNYRPAPGAAAGSMPAEFALQSRVFRLTSAGRYVRLAPAGAEDDVVTSTVEAVVQLLPDGTWRTLHWALNPDSEGR